MSMMMMMMVMMTVMALMTRVTTQQQRYGQFIMMGVIARRRTCAVH
jgi:hypothetical protein